MIAFHGARKHGASSISDSPAPPRGLIALLVAIAITAMPPLAAADEVPTDGAAENGNAVIDNDEPALCHALLQQAEAAMERGESYCGLPTTDPALGLSRPDWRPIDPAEIEPLLKQYLPLYGWDTRGVQTLIKQSMPQASNDELRAEHWRRYGAAMMEALRAREGLLETAVMDVDNDGSVERVYRTAILRPVDKVRPELGWRPLPCGIPKDAPTEGIEIVPYRALFFEDNKRRDMGILAHFDKIETHDLFLFKGRSYSNSMAPSSVSAVHIQVQKLSASQQEAVRYSVCLISRRPQLVVGSE